MRLCMAECARLTGVAGYIRTPRSETAENGDTWDVIEEEGEIVLTGRIGERAKQNGQFEANRLRGQIGSFTQRLSQSQDQMDAAESFAADIDLQRQDPNRMEAYNRLKTEHEYNETSLKRAEDQLEAAEEASSKDTAVQFRFPHQLMESTDWR